MAIRPLGLYERAYLVSDDEIKVKVWIGTRYLDEETMEHSLTQKARYIKDKEEARRLEEVGELEYCRQHNESEHSRLDRQRRELAKRAKVYPKESAESAAIERGAKLIDLWIGELVDWFVENGFVPPDPEKQTPSSKLRDLPGLGWHEVTIVIRDDDLIEISARGIEQNYNSANLGLSDRRAQFPKPTKPWSLLLAFAKQKEIKIPAKFETPKEHDNLKQAVRRLRKALKAVLQMDDDPFFDARKSHFWKPKFKVVDNRPKDTNYELSE